MNYYYIGVNGRTTENVRVRGGHVIKAKSKKDALRIREKHGISNPRFAKGHLNIICRKLNPSDTGDKNLIKSRKAGLDGNIWYEDENGILQIET